MDVADLILEYSGSGVADHVLVSVAVTSPDRAVHQRDEVLRLGLMVPR